MFNKILIAIGVILIGIQFIPVDRTNPPVTQDINPPKNISAILRTSCYDCHSNETTWPWYSYVAPVSFLVSGDVKNGREHLNFSEWDRYDDEKQGKILEEILEEIEKGDMPLPKYLITHPDAEMYPEKIKVVKDWVTSKDETEKPLRYKKENEKE
jgi:hypothetical protein